MMTPDQIEALKVAIRKANERALKAKAEAMEALNNADLFSNQTARGIFERAAELAMEAEKNWREAMQNLVQALADDLIQSGADAKD